MADTNLKIKTQIQEELDEGEIKQIEKSLADIKKGKVLTLEEVE